MTRNLILQEVDVLERLFVVVQESLIIWVIFTVDLLIDVVTFLQIGDMRIRWAQVDIEGCILHDALD